MSNQPAQHEITSYEAVFLRIEEFLDNIKNNTADFVFLNFFAPRDFAKSHVLEQTWLKYEMAMPVSLVKVKEFALTDPLNPSGLLIKILSDFEQRLPPRLTALPPDYKLLSNPAQLADLIVQMVEKARDSQKAMLIMIDDYEFLPQETRRWLERSLFSRLSNTRQVGVILTSEFELAFNDEFDLRMRLDRYPISSLRVEDISRTFPQYRELAQEIYQLTGGIYPLASGLVQAMEEAGISPGTFPARISELKKHYFQKFVENDILGQFTPQEREIVPVLSVLRRFDIRMLYKVLPKTLASHNETYNQDEYLELIERLGSRVQWRPQGGYELNPSLRTVLLEYVRFSQPELVTLIHTVARDTYKTLLEDEYREYYLIEQVYHDVELQKLEKGAGVHPIREWVHLELEAYLNGESAGDVREDDLDSLRNALKQDQDLKAYVSEVTLNSIARHIHIRIYENRAIHKKSETDQAETPHSAEPPVPAIS